KERRHVLGVELERVLVLLDRLWNRALRLIELSGGKMGVGGERRILRPLKLRPGGVHLARLARVDALKGPLVAGASAHQHHHQDRRHWDNPFEHDSVSLKGW